MVKDVIVIYRLHETILILISLKCYFLGPKNQNLTKVILNFKEALFLFVALRPKSTAMVMVGLSVHLTTLFPGQA